MNWKLKSKIQNFISFLPSSASYSIYYWLQRKFGGLRHMNPVGELSRGIELWKLIQNTEHTPIDKVFFEIGTGRVALMPLAYWLMGAKKIITVDLNPYLKAELISESLQYISNNRTEIEHIFGSLLNQTRWQKLLEFSKASDFSIIAYLKLCNIEYIAPSDAANTQLPPSSIDFHTSSLVFEHIPFNILENIIKEGNRIIKKKGVFIHDIDYSDHFSHSDPTISAINFLSYSDEGWKRYAGNKYMYMNRLRHDDFLALFSCMEHNILESKCQIDNQSLAILKNKEIKINSLFKNKSIEVLAITRAWVISERNS